MPGNTNQSPSLKPATTALRILLVADSEIVGARVHKALDGQPDIEITSQARDGIGAVSAMRRSDYDAIVLDIGHAETNTAVALSRMFKLDPTAKVVLVGSLSFANVKASMKLLVDGAAAFVPTPAAHTKTTSEAVFSHDLLEVLHAFEPSDREIDGRPTRGHFAEPPARIPAQSAKPIELRPISTIPPRVLAVGSSTGGPQALFAFIASLPSDLSIPVFITQHMPANFTKLLADHIAKNTARDCREAVDGEPIVAGRLYVAPGDYHMTVIDKAGQSHIRLTEDDPVNYCRPSVDPMLDSITDIYDGQVLAVILTGMGADGADSASRLVAKGGTVLAQNQETCVVWGMPRAVAEAGICSAVLPLDELGPFVGTLVKPKW